MKIDLYGRPPEFGHFVETARWAVSRTIFHRAGDAPAGRLYIRRCEAAPLRACMPVKEARRMRALPGLTPADIAPCTWARYKHSSAIAAVRQTSPVRAAFSRSRSAAGCLLVPAPKAGERDLLCR